MRFISLFSYCLFFASCLSTSFFSLFSSHASFSALSRVETQLRVNPFTVCCILSSQRGKELTIFFAIPQKKYLLRSRSVDNVRGKFLAGLEGGGTDILLVQPLVATLRVPNIVILLNTFILIIFKLQSIYESFNVAHPIGKNLLLT